MKIDNIFLRMHPIHRILISLGLALITFLIIHNSTIDIEVKAMVIWNIFTFSFISTSWIVFYTRSTLMIRHHARTEDVSRLFVLIIVLLSAFASMFTVVLLIVSKGSMETSKFLYLSTTIAGIILSWFMVHTIFTFHYANLFYNDDDIDPKKHAQGLEFPEEKNPDYLDFAYFSFVIGMTFQVSDVVISSRIIRRTALLHSLLAFMLNTIVVALTINLILK